MCRLGRARKTGQRDMHGACAQARTWRDIRSVKGRLLMGAAVLGGLAASRRLGRHAEELISGKRTPLKSGRLSRQIKQEWPACLCGPDPDRWRQSKSVRVCHRPASPHRACLCRCGLDWRAGTLSLTFNIPFRSSFPSGSRQAGCDRSSSGRL